MLTFSGANTRGQQKYKFLGSSSLILKTLEIITKIICKARLTTEYSHHPNFCSKWLIFDHGTAFKGLVNRVDMLKLHIGFHN